MYQIEFYEDEKGHSEIAEYIKLLRQKSRLSKEHRINFNKIVAYFDLLEEIGTQIGEPITKHLVGEIWELRPLKHRFLYAYVSERKFLILHHFIKKTRKIPKKELESAKKKLKSYMERSR